jgi:DNA-binding protein H-NS
VNATTTREHAEADMSDDHDNVRTFQRGVTLHRLQQSLALVQTEIADRAEELVAEDAATREREARITTTREMLADGRTEDTR